MMFPTVSDRSRVQYSTSKAVGAGVLWPKPRQPSGDIPFIIRGLKIKTSRGGDWKSLANQAPLPGPTTRRGTQVIYFAFRTRMLLTVYIVLEGSASGAANPFLISGNKIRNPSDFRYIKWIRFEGLWVWRRLE